MDPLFQSEIFSPAYPIDAAHLNLLASPRAAHRTQHLPYRFFCSCRAAFFDCPPRFQ